MRSVELDSSLTGFTPIQLLRAKQACRGHLRGEATPLNWSGVDLTARLKKRLGIPWMIGQRG